MYNITTFITPDGCVHFGFHYQLVHCIKTLPGIDEILTFSKLKYILSGMLYLFKIIKTGFHLQKMSAMKQDIYVSCDD